MSYSTSQLQAIAAQAAAANGVPATYFNQIITDESSWNPNAQSTTSSATGIAQFTSATASQFGIDPTDPVASLNAAAKYLAQLYNQTGSWLGAAYAYGTTQGAGSKNVSGLVSALGQDGVAIAGPAASTGSAATSQTLFGGITQVWGDITNFFTLGTQERIVAVIIGVILIGVAITILLTNSKVVQQTVQPVIKAGKTVAALAA